jgi:class 3 adenylate cyclase
VFGPTVNLASRLTDIARRNTVAVPRPLAEAAGDRDDAEMRRIRRSYDLKGVGRTEIMAIRPRR